ncbi:MAG TPA: hypothetical protein VGM41_15805, partial [Chitinophagaceae bacterium]
MEIRNIIATLRKNAGFCLCALAILCFVPAAAQPPASVKSYGIWNGKMRIELSRNITGASLDSFITQFNLSGIGLVGLLQKHDGDSLEKLGWQVENSNKGSFLISKRLAGPDWAASPDNRILLTEKHPSLNELFPADNNGIVYGYNRFKNKYPFAINDSVVTFFLRSHQGKGRVLLAGSFTGWQNGALRMQPTDSGWIAQVKLKPGKYWYKFIIDGGWTTDPDNQLMENDGRGNVNSVYYKTNTLFTLNQYGDARRVYLSGSFNNWKSNDLPMIKTSTGWQLPLYLASGTYTYRFVVDGNNWMTDPANPVKFPNELHDYNSVVRIGKPHPFSLAGYGNARQVMLAGSFNNWRDYELPMLKTDGGWQLPYTLGGGN